MRSSKSRSRSKSNRQRSSLGNIVNRVFDSSGPEGKVRGTPQQIIDKYLMLARDAQLGNDRVAAENFLQHAEHYARMLGEAQRELDSQRRDFGGPGGGQGQQGGWQGSYGQGSNGFGQGYDDRPEDVRADQRPDQRTDQRPEGRGEARPEQRSDTRNDRRDDRPRDERRDDRPRDERRDDRPRDDRREERARDDRRDDRPRDDRREDRRPAAIETEVIDLGDEGDGGLVETPEMRSSAPRQEPPVQVRSDDTGERQDVAATEAPVAEADPAPKRAPRRPRRRAASGEVAEAEADAGGETSASPPSEAAE